jgi:hypothetical protein
MFRKITTLAIAKKKLAPAIVRRVLTRPIRASIPGHKRNIAKLRVE